MREWFDNAIIYQIYPKSFQDSNGDGIGDLQGIRQRIPYLKSLGIDAVWLNPIFVSPQVDNGYDVANYYAIDTAMGTMADMEGLIQDLHTAGIRLIMDFVLNHTSDQHPWFQDAIHDANSIYRDYYLFAGENGQQPNNWGSFFGGSVWTPDPAGTGQSYFHLFDKHMPDLNWANPEVRRAMSDVAMYWLDKGVDGLRLDAFIHIAKADLHQNYPVGPGQKAPVVAESFFANLPQVQDWLQPFCAQIRADYPHTLLLGEAASANVNLAVDYTAKRNGLMDSIVTFRYFKNDETAANPSYSTAYQPLPLDWPAFKQTQAVWQQTLAGVSRPTLYWNNHDMARLATRVAKNSTQARSLAMLMYLQYGIPIIYYGEELGMQNLQFDRAADFVDPSVDAFIADAQKAGVSAADALKMASQTHKLPARGPMPWDDSANHGFSSAKPWLSGRAVSDVSVASEEADPSSMLRFYRKLFHLKKQPVFSSGAWRLLDTSSTSYVFQRQQENELCIVAVNLSERSQRISLKHWPHMQSVLKAGKASLGTNQLNLGPYAGVVLSSEAEKTTKGD